MDPSFQVEKYLGGFDSIQLGKGLSAGYGIYASNHRLFGLRRRSPAIPLEIGQTIRDSSPENLTSSQSSQIIHELELRKDFEIPRDQILRLEMKKPPGIFRMGHLIIKLSSGEEVKVKIGKNKEYELLKTLMRIFDPEVLKVD